MSSLYQGMSSGKFFLVIAAVAWATLMMSWIMRDLEKIKRNVEQIQQETHIMFKLQQEQRAREMKY